ncbi:MAG: hypothetical protein N4A64_12705 [Marinisporobacter sp.]|jgi:hypothetical protein|nr:hypothetical protein [Marinisporobacter sp.]
MEIYMLIGALGILIFNIYNDRYHKRRSKIIAKSLERNIEYISSFGFFLAGLIYLRMIYGHKGDLINIELRYIQLAILYGSASVFFLIRSFQKDLINEEGICTSKGIYKWKKIICYEWGREEEMKVKKEVIQYYNLTFYNVHACQDTFFKFLSYELLS